MSIQPKDRPSGQTESVPPAQQFASPPVSPPTSSHGHSDECPACRGLVQPGQAVCVTCGTVLHSQPKQIRCRHCGKKGSSAYALCPHCGRGLVAAPPVWLSWGVPGALVLLFVLVLVSRMEGGPLQWVGDRMDGAVAVVENPLLTPVRGNEEITAVAEEGEAPAGETAAQSGGDEGVLAIVAPTDTPTAVLAALASTPMPEATATPTASPLPTATATATATATETATNTPELTATGIGQSGVVSNPPTVTATVTITGTAIAAERTYAVQTGDTAFSIAERFQVTAADLLKVNQLSPAQALNLKAGTILEIPGTGALDVAVSTVTSSPSATATPSPIEINTTQPTATATATPTSAPTSTPTVLVQASAPSQQTYTIVSGDTPVAIALRFNVSTEALLAANGLSLAQARSLYVGQQLIIPALGQPLPPTATASPGLQSYTIQAGDTLAGIATRYGTTTLLLMSANGLTAATAEKIRPGDRLIIPAPEGNVPAATPRSTLVVRATPTPAATFRLPAPLLIDPGKDVAISCGAEQTFKWGPVDGMWPGDEYVVFLGYVNSAPDAAGAVEVVPLLAQHIENRTDMLLDGAYCGLSPQSFGRRWRWYMQIFNGETPVSPPSETWEFSWR